MFSDPSPSTPAQRANFTATELFNNQDLYSSRRYAPSSTLSSSSVSSSSLLKSSSSSVVGTNNSSATATALGKSNSSASIVNRMLNKEVNNNNNSSNSNSMGLVGSKSTSSVLANCHQNGNSSIGKTVSNSNGEGDVMLPCEFCEEMIPMFKLLSHQGRRINTVDIIFSEKFSFKQ